ncbi:MAG: hypothetical protein LBE24_10655 [Methylobacillus sp.]|jgi:hypothetical protein|nr:hypothetical protein [Methylobacillus sp.]
MIPALRPFLVFRGDTRSVWWRWRSGGRPVDLTGCQIELVIEDQMRGNAIYTVSVANGKLDSPGDSGVIRGAIPAEDTAGFTFAEAYYRLVITHPSGAITTLLHGPVTVR